MSPLAWLQENVRVYFGNATARKDYRAQLRGTRAIFLWGGYLLILILLAGVTYSSIISADEQPVAQLQFQLREFYFRVMRLSSILLIFIAPALTATSVVSERMMKSLDLVFTSPMTPKQLLVGKMISSLRYTWMLLILALPVTAVSVIMGGATWVDVLAAYVILSASAFIATSIGLLISALTNTPVAAILWTYVAVSAFVAPVTVAAYYTNEGLQQGIGGQAQPWVFALSPFYAAQSAPTHTLIGSTQVPNYLIVTVFALLFGKLMLLGAGSALSAYGARETKSLRVHLLLYAFVVALFFGRIHYYSTQDYLASVAGVVATAMCVLLPFIICGSKFADRKHRLDEPFNLVAMFDGRPSGALPFLWVLSGALVGGYMVGAATINVDLSQVGPITMLWMAAFWTFWWAVGRATSVMTSDLRVSRLLLVTMMLLIMGLPVPIASVLAPVGIFEQEGIWQFYILHPIGRVGQNMVSTGMQHAIGLFIVAAIIAVCSELERRRQYRNLQVAT